MLNIFCPVLGVILGKGCEQRSDNAAIHETAIIETPLSSFMIAVIRLSIMNCLSQRLNTIYLMVIRTKKFLII